MVDKNPHRDHGFLKKVLFFLKFLEIRLRFVFILVITALLVGYWDNIQNHVERWQRNRAGHGHEHAAGQAESEFEFFCPMHPFVVRDHKDKCPICGMDLVQRRKGAPTELPAGTIARVQVSPERVMQGGIQVEPVGYRLLTRTVRTNGVIEPDETRLAKIVARFPGRIDKLMVNAVGMEVKKGEPLAQIYSPKFLSATQEYVQALRAEKRAATAEERQRAQLVTASARQRLLMAGFTEEQLGTVTADGGPQDTVTLYSPLAGTVLEKNALLGETVMEETSLYTIADLTKVWIQALTPEGEISAVRTGMAVEVTAVAYPGVIFYGTVDFISPTVEKDNRAVRVRVAVDNPGGKLKPGMYVNAVMRSPVGRMEEAAQGTTQTATAAGAPGSTGVDARATKTPTENQADADRFVASLTPGAEYYVCPMDPEVVSEKMADCPKCGMHLEKKQKPGAAPGAAAATTQTMAMAMPKTPGEDARGIKTPTENQADADKFMAALAPGAEYYQCPMHPEVVSEKAADCPKCGMHLEKKAKAAASERPARPAGTRETPEQVSTERWAEGYSCSMHPDELSDKPGICTICGCGMKLVLTRIERVLAVPEISVIDTGTRQVIYIETSPGVYDSRAITLGPRAGAYYPVLAGLKLGDRIVSRGSFLIDAEARLNPTAVATEATTAAAAAPAAGHAGHAH